MIYRRNGYCFFNIDIDYRVWGDHAPEFSIIFAMFNILIFEFQWYDIRHTEDRYEL